VKKRVRQTLTHIPENAERQPDGCLVWTRWTSQSGYGVVCAVTGQRPVAQVVWEIFHGREVPAGHYITRTCGRRNCLEISHLKLVERREHLKQTSVLIVRKALPPVVRFRRHTKEPRNNN
jgi:hypothetical protein